LKHYNIVKLGNAGRHVGACCRSGGDYVARLGSLR
jgi:hypothetical protein